MLTTKTENRDGVQLVRLAGALDAAAQADFREQLGVWAQPAGARIVLDCAELAYASSEGLALLVQGPPGHPRFFGIAGLNRRISGTIELLGMDRRLNRFASVEQALAAAAS